MKSLYLIGGTMGVGKTSVCTLLNEKLEKSVFLDGDWCWYSNPFTVTEETKEMVIDNICYILNNYIRCSAFKNIVFCWVMHEQSIIDKITSKLSTVNCRTINISLICNERSLTERLKKDIESGKRSSDILERSIARIPLYLNLDTVKIETSDKTVRKIADDILRI